MAVHAAKRQPTADLVVGMDEPSKAPSVRRRVIAGQSIARLLDGPANEAAFSWIMAVCEDSPDSKTLVVSDCHSHAIRLVDKETGTVSTLVGYNSMEGLHDGSLKTARMTRIHAVCVAPAPASDPTAQGLIYVADAGNNVVRCVDRRADLVSTLKDDDPATNKRGFHSKPDGLAIYGNRLFLSYEDDVVIRMCDLTTKVFKTVAGRPQDPGYQDGPGSEAQFRAMGALAVSPRGRLIICDDDNNRVRWIDLADPLYTVHTLLGRGETGHLDGPADQCMITRPWFCCCDAVGNVFIACCNFTNRRWDAKTGYVSTLSSTDFGDCIVLSCIGNTLYGKQKNTMLVAWEGVASDGLRELVAQFSRDVLQPLLGSVLPRGAVDIVAGYHGVALF